LRINATSLFQREVLHRQSFALTVRLAGKTMVQLIVSTSSVSFGNDAAISRSFTPARFRICERF
jgi:hypothetical protein